MMLAMLHEWNRARHEAMGEGWQTLAYVAGFLALAVALLSMGA